MEKQGQKVDNIRNVLLPFLAGVGTGAAAYYTLRNRQLAEQQAGFGQLPRDKTLDNTFALLCEGYHFIQNRCRRFHSDIFETRLFGERVLCMSGKEAAKLFYDTERFQRKGAAPKRIQKTLFGENGVQTMDDAAHKHRKLLFMSLMTPERLKVLADLTLEQWEAAIGKWEAMDQVVLFDEVQDMLCRIACQWAGVPLEETEVKQRASDFGTMIDAFGGVGPRYWSGKRARARAEEWIRGMIEHIRSFKLNVPKDTAAYAMAWHRDINGMLLDTQMAAVELINILRPIVAIATYITFGALALHEHPECREKLRSNENQYVHMFVQEIRRFYPFGPFLGARVKNDFTWKQIRFIKGTLVLLDIYGINHDSRLWEKPYEFRPERFKDWSGNLFDFVPQGGGDYYQGHRCAGEWLTVEIMKTSFDFLTKHIEYQVPDQDLRYSLVRVPTLPNSRFAISNVRRKNAY
ncbi:fatty-acid peroxygenase [Scopulibacillus daqui]|uniref:Fatty-acid peroxygenase n=1 Tax=Scopulibacillus daqui TaxID=1469162 RepID=A0ABS2PXW2_9BACL|nr:cytochrome P450 [Scopulibacillus daqui]MBM7644898.1 fatty-acid peroxygenase [Scopulibacillus daqui]